MPEPSNETDLEDHSPEEIARAGALAWSRIALSWTIDNATAADLVAVSPRTWGRMKAGGWTGRLGKDQLRQVSALIGIYKALHIYFYFDDELADRWPRLPNTGSLFGGRTPLDAMRAGGLPTILEARDYLDALRGGA